MLTYDEARHIGVNACIDKLGREFMTKYQNNASAGFGDRGDHVFCFVGVDDRPEPEMKNELILTSGGKFPYLVACNVAYEDGHIDFLEVTLPQFQKP